MGEAVRARQGVANNYDNPQLKVWNLFALFSNPGWISILLL
jgi:hypothetical protein